MFNSIHVSLRFMICQNDEYLLNIFLHLQIYETNQTQSALSTHPSLLLLSLISLEMHSLDLNAHLRLTKI